MEMYAEETKFIIEIRKDYTKEYINKIMNVTGGVWESVKDEWGNDRIFDYFFQAYKELQIICPDVKFFGGSVGRVKEVVMLPKRKDEK